MKKLIFSFFLLFSLAAHAGFKFPFSGYAQLVSKTTTYAMSSTDDIVQGSGSAFTVTLPSATARGARPVWIRKTDSSFANIITIARAGADTIQGGTSTTLNSQYESVMLMPVGTDWIIIQRVIPNNTTSCTLSSLLISTGGGSPAFGTNTSICTYDRIGNKLHWHGNVLQTANGTTGTAGTYNFTLPGSLTADTNFAPTGTVNPNGISLGFASFKCAASSNTGGNAVILWDSTHIAMQATNSGSNFWGTGTTGCILGSSADVELSFDVWIPISGWNG